LEERLEKRRCNFTKSQEVSDFVILTAVDFHLLRARNIDGTLVLQEHAAEVS
jgi:hypothetical protein